jgi:hypothetical protein
LIIQQISFEAMSRLLGGGLRVSLAVMSLMVSILAHGHLSAASTSTAAEIFYVGFGGDTYSPITRENIEDEHTRYGNVNIKNPVFERLMTILSNARMGRGCFNPKRVRLKIRTLDSIFFVDEEGAIEGVSGLRFLSEPDKNSVQTLIEVALTDFRTRPLPPSRLPIEELETCN